MAHGRRYEIRASPVAGDSGRTDRGRQVLAGEDELGAVAALLTKDRCAMRTLLTVYQVALKLRVSKMTVYRLIQAGKLPAYRVGRNYRIDPRTIEGLMQEGTG
jgi:excisionase family DNA binding protein